MNDNDNGLSRQDAPQRDEARHTLTVEEASALFNQAGVPRSVRSIQRYCRHGHLDCIRIDTELSEKYLIDRNSVERRIKELQQIQQFTRAPYVAPRRDETRHDAAERDTSRHDVREEGEPKQERTEKIDQLEQQIFNLKIDNKAKEQIIGQFVSERREFIAQLTEQSRQIGTLETRLLQLEAPSITPRQGGDDPPHSSHTEHRPPSYDQGDGERGDNSHSGNNYEGVQ